MTLRFKNWMDERAESPEFGFDHADLVTFNSKVVELPSFDRRSVGELDHVARLDASPMQRERAIWELFYRDASSIGYSVRKYFDMEQDSRVRANLLWLARKCAPFDAISLVEHAINDSSREVRDWAKLHASEIRDVPFQSEYDKGTYVRGRSFDQTLPLEIAGFAVMPFGDVDLRVVLSPLWFAHIQGRVMACTRDETFMTRLTIEKRYAGFHPDGSDHYEIYPFIGKSWRSSEFDTEHRYLTNARQRFYLSGRVEEDPSETCDVRMGAGRAAQTTGRLIDVEEREIGRKNYTVRRVVSHVKGQYFGWAHASVRHYLESGDILPGTIQLINPTETSLAPLVNCYICGTFRGKIADHNGDGLLDVNDIVCHGLEDGRLDYQGDMSLAPDPFA
ncbi:hypothetical protein [Mesorhizobium sp. ES1-6]|uniref:hypothetical protein n=1 Tax=Mesorhizobium sp. ES1-6 TaxID=2876626 RepID=UPI001CCB9DDB|nr:hypothetical protein [Mesorhizobium sp. ES1-6]MBZ9803457.1 hypothetical protein [Mesorhizobium sp. ES1-6]